VNTIAARLGVQVGIPKVIETSRALGIESELPEVPSLSLGVAELSPVELLRAYATVANHGEADELTVIRAVTRDLARDEMERLGASAPPGGRTFVAHFAYNPRQALPPGPSDLLTDMLQNVFVEGTARAAYALGFDRPAAGKTGTTSHYRDSWFAGYTPQLTAVVWVGMDQMRADQKTSVKLTGAGAALPIWVEFMNEALAGEAPAAFPLSPALTQVRIDTRSGKRADGGCPDAQVTVERVVAGREPAEESCEAMYPPSVSTTEM
jgi:membrane peptidoglycan carboxypeptidase